MNSTGFPPFVYSIDGCWRYRCQYEIQF